MVAPAAPTAPVAAALAVVLHEDRLLLVQRRNPPDQWLWGYPGGKIEPGETMSAAALRELREETGIVAEALGLLEPFDVLHRDPSGRLLHHYILIPSRCRWLAGMPAAASDANDARWFSMDELERQPELFSARVLPLARDALSCSDLTVSGNLRPDGRGGGSPGHDSARRHDAPATSGETP